MTESKTEKTETYTLVVYQRDGELEGPFFQLFCTENLTQKQKKLFLFWEKLNKEKITSADLSCGRDAASTKKEKKYLKIVELLESGQDVHDLSQYLGHITQIIRISIW